MYRHGLFRINPLYLEHKVQFCTFFFSDRFTIQKTKYAFIRLRLFVCYVSNETL
jgi:hypothetical protein